MPKGEPLNGDAGLDLEELYGDREMPQELEDRVVDDLVDRGWLVRTGGRWLSWSKRLAASLLLFAMGWGFGSRADAAPAEASSRFMFLLWEGPGFAAAAAPESFADEYAGWASSLARRGVTLSGSELGPARVVLSPEGNRTAPPDDLRLGGYFIVGAETASEAQTIAEGHPHLGHGGWVEVAPLVSR